MIPDRLIRGPKFIEKIYSVLWLYSYYIRENLNMSANIHCRIRHAFERSLRWHVEKRWDQGLQPWGIFLKLSHLALKKTWEIYYFISILLSKTALLVMVGYFAQLKCKTEEVRQLRRSTTTSKKYDNFEEVRQLRRSTPIMDLWGRTIIGKTNLW